MAAKSLLLMALAGMALVAQPAGRGVISGAVMDASSGDPVRKAVVTLTWQGTPRSWATTRTDESGRFQFEGLPPGKYDLRATKAGDGTAIYGAESVRELGDFISLGDGETLAGLKLRVVHSASISGRVFDPEGDPVPGANVTLLRPGRNMGVRILVNYQTISTNDRGEYRFTGIDPGEYYARSMPNRSGGFRRIRNGAEGPPQEAVLGVYYAGARLSKDASPLTIHGGESLAGIDFHLISEQTAQVKGHVSGAPKAIEDNPHVGPYIGEFVEVQVSSLDENQLQQGYGAAVQQDASFNVPEIPVGRYRISAMTRNSSQAFAAAQVVDLHPGVNDVDLALTPAIEIKGQVRFEGPPLTPAAHPQVVLMQPGIRGENVSAFAGSDGRFTLAQVFPGEWEINVNQMPPGSFLKSVRLGDKDILFTRFEIESADAPISIVISTNTAKIEGEVDSGGVDAARAGIVLAPVGKLHDFARFYYGVPADDQGKFKLNGIAPGKYRIFALEKMAPANFRNPETADQLGSLGEEIELTEGKTLEAHPKLIPQARAREALP